MNVRNLEFLLKSLPSTAHTALLHLIIKKLWRSWNEDRLESKTLSPTAFLFAGLLKLSRVCVMVKV